MQLGTGQVGMKEILDEFRRQGFCGNVSLEYEYNWDNNAGRRCLHRFRARIRQDQSVTGFRNEMTPPPGASIRRRFYPVFLL